MKFIILGAAGRMGSLHAKHLREMGHEVVEIDPKLPPMLDNKHPEHWPSLRADGVVIATPVDRHHKDLTAAVNAGLPVFIEKPICIIGKEYLVRAVLDLAKEKNIVVSVGYNLRFHPAVMSIKDAILAGKIKPLWGSFLLRQKPKQPIAYFLAEWASHEVDLALHLLGSSTVERLFMLDNDHPSMALAVEHAGRPLRISFIFADAITEAPFRRAFTIVDEDGKSVTCDIETDHVQEEHYKEELAAWIYQIETREETYGATGEEGLAVIELLRRISEQ